MTWSKVTKLFDGASIVEDTASSVVDCQRTWDETGAFQIELNQDPDPGGGSTGRIVLEGRVHPDLSWGEIKTKNITDFDGGSGASLVHIFTDVQIVTQMRAVFRDTISVAGGTTCDATLME